MDSEIGPSEKDVSWKAPEVGKATDSSGEETKPLERKEGEPPTITNASSLEELKEALGNVDSLQGSKQEYSGEQLLQILDQVIDGNASIDRLTRAGGLRGKAEQLLKEDPEASAK